MPQIYINPELETFGKHWEIKIFVLKCSKKVKFEAYSDLKTENIFNKNLMVGYVHIEDLFDTIFNMGYGEGACKDPHPFPQ